MTEGESGKELWFQIGDELIRRFVPKAYPLSQELLRDLAAVVNKHNPAGGGFPEKQSFIDLLWEDLSYLLPHYIAEVQEETGTEPDWSACKPFLEAWQIEYAKKYTIERRVLASKCRDLTLYLVVWLEETAAILKAMGALSAELEEKVEKVRELMEEKQNFFGLADRIGAKINAEGEKTRKVFNAKFSQEQPTTQKQRAALFGVDRKTIARWEKPPKGKTSSAPEGYDPWLPMEALRIAGIKYRASAEALKRISMKKAEAEIAAEEAQED